MKIPILITQLPQFPSSWQTLQERGKNKPDVGVLDFRAEKVSDASTINRGEKKKETLAPIILKKWLGLSHRSKTSLILT